MQSTEKEPIEMQSVALTGPASRRSELEAGHRGGQGGSQPRLLLANLIFLGLAVLYLLVTTVGDETVQPLVQADPQTSRRIEHLERALLRQPGAADSALELAQLYRDAGEFPWSYDALRDAERTGTDDPGWRLKLGLAYLQVSKSEDALRVLRAARQRCRRPGAACPGDVRVKLDIFVRVAELLKKRGIQPHKHRLAAEQALREVLKPVEVDPAKMRPKAPAGPVQPAVPSVGTAPKKAPK